MKKKWRADFRLFATVTTAADFLFFVHFMQISGKKLRLPAIKSKALGLGLTVMAPFPWPTTFHNLQLATEVAAARPNSPAEWDNVAQALGRAFSSEDKNFELTGRVLH